MIKQLIAIICIVTLISACAAPINRETSKITAQAGYLAQQQGDWDAARRNYAKAVVNAELGNEPPQAVAVLQYEYGRSLGVTCYFEEAEEYLAKALKTDRENSGPAHMSILELARLNYDQERYPKAAKYFAELLPIYKKHQAEQQDPVGVADVYTEYAIALKALGQNSASSSFEQRAGTLRSNNVGGISGTEPYGTQCSNN